MKILAPLNSPAETEMLLANGAEELYCGLVPEEWVARYSGAIWLNRRSPAGGNLRTFSDLARVVEQAHGRSVPVFVTLNAQTYTAGQLPLVLDLARRYVEEAGADGLIVSDPALILQLAEQDLPCALHLSSIAASLNVAAVRFFQSLGVRRVILPRSLTLAEIGRIAREIGSQVELEVFILNDGCIFEEGFCLTTHHPSVGAFCVGLARMESQSFKLCGTPWAREEEEEINTLLQDFHHRIDGLTNHACSAPAQTALPLAPCGLCSIPAFHRMGISAVKIVGREASSLRKLASLRLVRAVVEKARNGALEEDVQVYAQTLRESVAPCVPGEMCYHDAGATTSRTQSARERGTMEIAASTPSSVGRRL
ncbi:MAG: U32 family peptidase [Terriglobales bacterium]